MRNNLILIISAISTLFGFSAAKADEKSLDGPVRATILRVVDGDTVAVRAHIWLKQDVETLVRLRGIDTPEKRSRCEREKELARQAHTSLEQLVSTEWVMLYEIGQDKYGGRVVARLVTPTGQDAAEYLIRQGLAHPYDGGTKQKWCDDTTASAG